MAKYKFNPESLSFDRIRLGIWGWFWRLFKYFFAGLLVTIIYVIVFSKFFLSPREKLLTRENEQMKLQYEIMQEKMKSIDEVLTDLAQRDDNLYRAILEAEPIPRSIRKAGIGGINRYSDLDGYENSDLVVNTAKKLDGIMKKVYVQSKSYDKVIDLARNKEQMLACMPAIQPLTNTDLTRTSSGWGYRIHPIYKIKVFHYGLDFAAPVGTEVYSTGNGVVERVERSMRGYGNNVIVDHGFGYKTLYAHMNDFNVRLGQKVKRGDIIGFVGNTGFSTGPHLHYEVIKNNEKVNPINYFYNDLNPEQYDLMIAISSNNGQTFD
jgi:murein DD-endopeptidase MepM/ murein hydrolase activator NlpD